MGTYEHGDRRSLRGARTIASTRSLMQAAELRLIVDRRSGSPIDARFAVQDGKGAITAIGRRCDWQH